MTTETDTGPSADVDAPQRPRRSMWPWIALAAVLGLALGYVAGFVVTPALTRPGDTSADAGFARDMTNHHAQAVEMGLIAYQRATNPTVRTVGQDIALNQQGQIGTMQAWLREWRLDPTGSGPAMAWMPEGTAALQNGLMPGMATDAQMASLRSATGKQVDIQFLTLMRLHHLGGIHMAEGVLKQSDDPEVRRFAQLMIDGQKSEIALITGLLDEVNASR